MRKTKAELLEENQRLRRKLDRCLSDIEGWKAVCRVMEDTGRESKAIINTQQEIINLLENRYHRDKEATHVLPQ